MNSNKIMDLPAEGVVVGTVVVDETMYKGTITSRTPGDKENYSNNPKNDYLESIQVVTNIKGQFSKAHITDAGYDILASVDCIVRAESSSLINTGLKISIPKGYVGVIKSRSGLSVNHGIDIGAGVIDCGYTGEVKVLLRNTSDKWFDILKGDKIAQMIIIPICPFDTRVVDSLEDSDRGENGFNSTGYR